MFLNTTATVTNWNADSTECSLVRNCCRIIHKVVVLLQTPLVWS